MKIKDIKDPIIKGEIRLATNNRRNRRKMLKTGKCGHKMATEEQLYLAKICIKLDTNNIKFLEEQLCK